MPSPTGGSPEYDFSFRGIANPRGIVRTIDRALHELRGTPGARHPASDV